MDVMNKVAFASLIVTMLLLTVASVSAQQVSFYIYGSRTCMSCSWLKKFLVSRFGEDSVIFNDFYKNETRVMIYEKIYELVFPDLPSWDRVTPLTGVMCDDKLVAVVAGLPEKNPEFWCELARDRGYLLLIYPNGTRRTLTDPDLCSQIAECFKGSLPTSVTIAEPASSSREVIWPVATAALADSVNPCTFSVFTALVLLATSAGGRRRAVLVGSSFIVAVFLAYYALGFGLIEVFTAIPWLKYAVAVLGIAVGSYEICTSLGGRFKSPLPAPLYRTTSKLVDWTSKAASIPLAFAAGLVISVTLLPCSSGPYLVATSLLAGLPTYERILLLGMYNLIFVAPLIGILLIMGALQRKVREVKVWRTKKLHVMNLVAGTLLVLICLYALLTW